MNTTIIDKILIHMLDMEHSQIIYSDQFIDLIEGTTEYYDKKIEKMFKRIQPLKNSLSEVNIIYYKRLEI